MSPGARRSIMRIVLGIALVGAGLAVASRGGDKPPLPTVPEVDLARYMGKWYEIAAFPQRFEKGCHCTTAEYEMTAKGYVRVLNSCRKGGAQGKLKVARGKAFVVAGSGNAKLRVQFFWPFRGDYWIIDLAPDYSYAVVGERSREYLWILARTPRLDEALYQEILARVKDLGFDVGRLVRTDQSCSD
jgi:apolipoprotein D and lipocalin family protein